MITVDKDLAIKIVKLAQASQQMLQKIAEQEKTIKTLQEHMNKSANEDTEKIASKITDIGNKLLQKGLISSLTKDAAEQKMQTVEGCLDIISNLLPLIKMSSYGIVMTEGTNNNKDLTKADEAYFKEVGVL